MTRGWACDVIAIDPGPVQSAYVLLRNGRDVAIHAIVDNAKMLDVLEHWSTEDHCAIEMIASYGMAVGAEVFETVYWIGRFAERWETCRAWAAHRVFRREVKMHLCGNTTAKDVNIRQAILDRYGGKAAAIGRKSAPGPLYGIRADEWQALALALTFADREAP